MEEAKEAQKSVFSNTSSMAIGHKELMPYFDGVDTLENCIENLKMQTRRYAKRQLTWFGRNSEINWINLSSTDKALEEAVSVLKNKGVIA